MLVKGQLARFFAFGLLLGLRSQALGADSPADELKAVRSRIEQLEKQMQEKEHTRQEAAQAVKSSEREIGDARRRLKELQGKQRALLIQLKEFDQQRTSLNQELEGQRTLVAQLVRQQYLNGAPESLQLILTGKDANDISRQMHYLSYVSKARGQLITSLRDNLAQLDSVTAQTAEKSKELAALHAEAEKEKKRLEKERRAREGVLHQVSKDIKSTKEQIDTLKKDEQRLTTLVARLAKELAKKSKGKRKKNLKMPEPMGDTEFSKLKGKLRLPVLGELTNRFGSPRSDTGLSWKGLVIAAKPGEPVKAIAMGRVVFADWLRGFGNLMILDHGEGYMSLYGYNATLTRRVGAEVNAGDKIATVGAGDGIRESGLYFEVRQQGKPVDPMKWMAR
jgi:murein hydrolase activator